MISEHIKAKALRIDTSLLIKQKAELKSVIVYQDENLKSLNTVVVDQTKIMSVLKKDFGDLQIKFIVVSRKVVNRGKAVLILIGTTVVMGAIAILKP